MRLYSCPHFRRDFRHTRGLPALKYINNNIRHSKEFVNYVFKTKDRNKYFTILASLHLGLRKSDVGRVRPSVKALKLFKIDPISLFGDYVDYCVKLL